MKVTGLKFVCFTAFQAVRTPQTFVVLRIKPHNRSEKFFSDDILQTNDDALIFIAIFFTKLK